MNLTNDCCMRLTPIGFDADYLSEGISTTDERATPNEMPDSAALSYPTVASTNITTTTAAATAATSSSSFAAMNATGTDGHLTPAAMMMTPSLTGTPLGPHMTVLVSAPPTNTNNINTVTSSSSGNNMSKNTSGEMLGQVDTQGRGRGAATRSMAGGADHEATLPPSSSSQAANLTLCSPHAYTASLLSSTTNKAANNNNNTGVSSGNGAGYAYNMASPQTLYQSHFGGASVLPAALSSSGSNNNTASVSHSNNAHSIAAGSAMSAPFFASVASANKSVLSAAMPRSASTASLSDTTNTYPGRTSASSYSVANTMLQCTGNMGCSVATPSSPVPVFTPTSVAAPSFAQSSHTTATSTAATIGSTGMSTAPPAPAPPVAVVTTMTSMGMPKFSSNPFAAIAGSSNVSSQPSQLKSPSPPCAPLSASTTQKAEGDAKSNTAITSCNNVAGLASQPHALLSLASSPPPPPPQPPTPLTCPVTTSLNEGMSNNNNSSNSTSNNGKPTCVSSAAMTADITTTTTSAAWASSSPPPIPSTTTTTNVVITQSPPPTIGSTPNDDTSTTTATTPIANNNNNNSNTLQPGNYLATRRASDASLLYSPVRPVGNYFSSSAGGFASAGIGAMQDSAYGPPGGPFGRGLACPSSHSRLTSPNSSREVSFYGSSNSFALPDPSAPSNAFASWSTQGMHTSFAQAEGNNNNNNNTITTSAGGLRVPGARAERSNVSLTGAYYVAQVSNAAGESAPLAGSPPPLLRRFATQPATQEGTVQANAHGDNHRTTATTTTTAAAAIPTATMYSPFTPSAFSTAAQEAQLRQTPPPPPLQQAQDTKDVQATSGYVEAARDGVLRAEAEKERNSNIKGRAVGEGMQTTTNHNNNTTNNPMHVTAPATQWLSPEALVKLGAAPRWLGSREESSVSSRSSACMDLVPPMPPVPPLPSSSSMLSHSLPSPHYQDPLGAALSGRPGSASCAEFEELMMLPSTQSNGEDQNSHPSGQTRNGEPLVPVYDPDFKDLLAIPASQIFHRPHPCFGVSRLVLCRNFVLEKGPESCSKGARCKFVHADTTNVTRSSIHVNYAWRSLELCSYPRLPGGDMLRVLAPNERQPSEWIPSERVLVTRGSVNWRQHSSPLSHCAHYYFNRMCNRGERCNFIHAVYVDPNVQGDFKRAPAPMAVASAGIVKHGHNPLTAATASSSTRSGSSTHSVHEAAAVAAVTASQGNYGPFVFSPTSGTSPAGSMMMMMGGDGLLRPSPMHTPTSPLQPPQPQPPHLTPVPAMTMMMVPTSTAAAAALLTARSHSPSGVTSPHAAAAALLTPHNSSNNNNISSSRGGNVDGLEGQMLLPSLSSPLLPPQRPHERTPSQTPFCPDNINSNSNNSNNYATLALSQAALLQNAMAGNAMPQLSPTATTNTAGSNGTPATALLSPLASMHAALSMPPSPSLLAQQQQQQQAQLQRMSASYGELGLQPMSGPGGPFMMVMGQASASSFAGPAATTPRRSTSPMHAPATACPFAAAQATMPSYTNNNNSNNNNNGAASALQAMSQPMQSLPFDPQPRESTQGYDSLPFSPHKTLGSNHHTLMSAAMVSEEGNPTASSPTSAMPAAEKESKAVGNGYDCGDGEDDSHEGGGYRESVTAAIAGRAAQDFGSIGPAPHDHTDPSHPISHNVTDIIASHKTQTMDSHGTSMAMTVPTALYSDAIWSDMPDTFAAQEDVEDVIGLDSLLDLSEDKKLIES